MDFLSETIEVKKKKKVENIENGERKECPTQNFIDSKSTL